jgi:hypothetical protein
MDPRLSRRDKLLSIPVSHLLPVVRSSIVKSRHDDIDVISILCSCADRGDSESVWLLEKLEGIPKDMWIVTISTIEEDIPVALVHDIELLRKSAEAGFVPAMARLGLLTRDTNLMIRKRH